MWIKRRGSGVQRTLSEYNGGEMITGVELAGSSSLVPKGVSTGEVFERMPAKSDLGPDAFRLFASPFRLFASPLCSLNHSSNQFVNLPGDRAVCLK
jgi:hypothetical protein